MMNRVLELLKRIWRALRYNLGLKIVSLIFALILWNYVIAEVNPAQPRTLHDINIRINNETAMKQANLTIKGDKSQYFQPVDVTLQVPRRELGLLKDSDVTLWVDLSTVTHDGTQKVKINATSTRGTVLHVDPDTVTLNIERLSTKMVPVSVDLTGTLPQNYWNSTPQLDKTSLVITGARTDIDQVERATVTVSLDNLTGSVSRPCDYTLLDANGAVVALGNMSLDPPNDIVNVQVYPTKTVPVRAEDRFYGSLPDGYERTSVTVDPPQIQVAAPADVLASLSEVVVPRINLNNATSTFNLTQLTPELPKGAQFVGTGTVMVTVGVQMKMTTVTLPNLRVTVTGLDSGLTVDEKLTASVNVTCPELYSSRVRDTRVHLYVDANGLTAGTHALPIRVEVDPTIDSQLAIATPSELSVTIRSTATTTAAMGGP